MAISYPGFHAKDGWYFERRPDGTVMISAAVQRCTETLEIGPAEWASIVAAVSRDGGTSQTFAAAQAIHEPATAT